MFGRIGPAELLLLLGLALIIFGPKKLPEIGKSLGKSINEFKRSVSTSDDEKPVSGQNQEVLSQPESDQNDNERNE